MVKKIIYLNVAIHDLSSIYNYISQDSIKYARLEVQRIKAFTESLLKHPFKGKFYKTIKGQEIRSIVYRNYIIFYKTDDSAIFILTIHHHARSIARNPAFDGAE
ncbi:type II toxin-antitoxin system RelE/ParE family toxin [Mucilaginibacter sp. HD30]